MFRKGLAVTVILLFIGMCIVPSTAFQELKDVSTVSFDGNILYVGGSGSNNYTKIQGAIDDSVDGDTVFVYDDSSPYYENVVVNKQINLIGEDKNSTIIDGMEYDDVIKIVSNDVYISGFTIQHSGIHYGAGIYLPSNIHSNNITICDNIIFENQRGIINYNSSNTTIKKNNIHKNQEYGISSEQSSYVSILENNISFHGVTGVFLYDCSRIDISNNQIYHNYFSGIGIQESTDCFIKNNSVKLSTYGLSLSNIAYCQILKNQISLCRRFNIQLSYTNNSIITGNIFSDSSKGMYIIFCNYSDITLNGIYQNNEYGVIIYNSSYINVFNNNFDDNVLHAYFIDSVISWNNNYWYRFRILPKLVLGRNSLTILNKTMYFPMFNIDWHPAQEPYDI